MKPGNLTLSFVAVPAAGRAVSEELEDEDDDGGSKAGVEYSTEAFSSFSRFATAGGMPARCSSSPMVSSRARANSSASCCSWPENWSPNLRPTAWVSEAGLTDGQRPL